MKLSKQVNGLIGQLALHVVKICDLGNICKSVYLVNDSSGRLMILKVGVDETSCQEIYMNMVGYSRLLRLGLCDFIPEIYACCLTGKETYILMEYCGLDFFSMIQNVEEPLKCYTGLCELLLSLYTKSLQNDRSADNQLVNVWGTIRQQYNLYISSFDDYGEILKLLDSVDLKLKNIEVNKSCFSNWDFTPEDVYLNNGVFKYTDPHEDILGIPILDLACFAGVARDAHFLPSAIEGYAVMKEFAIQSVGQLFDMDEEISRAIFYLGRVLQSFLSARFRMKVDKEQAALIVAQSKVYLVKVSDLL